MKKFSSNREIWENMIEQAYGHRYLGQPAEADGVQPAYGYCRIDRLDQTEQPQNLKRQLDAINDKALEQNIHIPAEMIFIEVSSGMGLDNRPELERMRSEYLSPNRRASIVVMEAIERLSRETSWQQGFLTVEMQRVGVTAVFSRGPSTNIHRMVVAQVGELGKNGGFKARLKFRRRPKNS